MNNIYLFIAFLVAIAVKIYASRKKPNHNIIGEQAIVIGCGIAGLLAAKSLSKKFKKVIIIEKDILPTKPESRRGTPQATQYHTLLYKGLQIMNRFFPGLSDSLKECNVPCEDFGASTKLNLTYGWIKPCKSGLIAISCSRPLLEFQVRKKLLEQTTNVEIREKSIVRKLIYNSESNTVLGVEISDSKENIEYELFGELVVDCGGAYSPNSGVHLLKEIGIDVKVLEVDAGVGYTSALYKFEENKPDFLAMFHSPNPARGENIGMAIGKVENELFHFTWFAYNKNYPPASDEELMEFTKKMRVPDMYEVLSRGKRVSPLIPYRNLKNRRALVDKINDFPENYILLGDSVASFTPIYGQGMTFTSLLAEEFDTLISNQDDKNLKGLSRKYNKSITKYIDLCWTTATGSDFIVPDVKSNTQPPTGFKFLHAYIEYIQQSLVEEPSDELYATIMKVIQMVSPGYVLLHPYFIIRALRLYLRSK